MDERQGASSRQRRGSPLFGPVVTPTIQRSSAGRGNSSLAGQVEPMGDPGPSTQAALIARSARTSVSAYDTAASGSDEDDEYERIRQSNIVQNSALLAELGLAQSPVEPPAPEPAVAPSGSARKKKPKGRRFDRSGYLISTPEPGTRHRLACIELPIFRQVDRAIDDGEYTLATEWDEGEERRWRFGNGDGGELAEGEAEKVGGVGADFRWRKWEGLAAERRRENRLRGEAELDARSDDDDGLEGHHRDANGAKIPYSMYEGPACHQCKRKSDKPKMRCRNVNPECNQFFCSTCCKRYYSFEFDVDSRSFICPLCRGICNCAYCLHKAKLSDLVGPRVGGSFITKTKEEAQRRGETMEEYIERLRKKENEIAPFDLVRLVDTPEDIVSEPLPKEWEDYLAAQQPPDLRARGLRGQRGRRGRKPGSVNRPRAPPQDGTAQTGAVGGSAESGKGAGTTEGATEGATNEAPPKKKRVRAPKVVDPNAPPRKRGRPRKNPVDPPPQNTVTDGSQPILLRIPRPDQTAGAAEGTQGNARGETPTSTYADPGAPPPVFGSPSSSRSHSSSASQRPTASNYRSINDYLATMTGQMHPQPTEEDLRTLARLAEESMRASGMPTSDGVPMDPVLSAGISEAMDASSAGATPQSLSDITLTTAVLPNALLEDVSTSPVRRTTANAVANGATAADGAAPSRGSRVAASTAPMLFPERFEQRDQQGPLVIPPAYYPPFSHQAHMFQHPPQMPQSLEVDHPFANLLRGHTSPPIHDASPSLSPPQPQPPRQHGQQQQQQQQQQHQQQQQQRQQQLHQQHQLRQQQRQQQQRQQQQQQQQLQQQQQQQQRQQQQRQLQQQQQQQPQGYQTPPPRYESEPRAVPNSQSTSSLQRQYASASRGFQPSAQPRQSAPSKHQSPPQSSHLAVDNQPASTGSQQGASISIHSLYDSQDRRTGNTTVGQRSQAFDNFFARALARQPTPLSTQHDVEQAQRHRTSTSAAPPQGSHASEGRASPFGQVDRQSVGYGIRSTQDSQSALGLSQARPRYEGQPDAAQDFRGLPGRGNTSPLANDISQAQTQAGQYDRQSFSMNERQHAETGHVPSQYAGYSQQQAGSGQPSYSTSQPAQRQSPLSFQRPSPQPQATRVSPQLSTQAQSSWTYTAPAASQGTQHASDTYASQRAVPFSTEHSQYPHSLPQSQGQSTSYHTYDHGADSLAPSASYAHEAPRRHRPPPTGAHIVRSPKYMTNALPKAGYEYDMYGREVPRG